MVKIFFGEHIVTPDGILENYYMECEKGTIIGLHQVYTGKIDEKFDTIIPGFIDLHNHGMGGSKNVLEYWFSDFTTRILPKYGTTSLLASITFPEDQEKVTSQIISHLEERVGKIYENQSVIEGIHAEGPIIATMSGLPPSNSNLCLKNFENLLDTMPSLRIMTISPSLEYKCDYLRIKALHQRGITPAIGHDANATELEILGAFKSIPEKQLHITHLFNVCSFHHRNVSLVNFGLLKKMPKFLGDLKVPSVEVIGDFVHVHRVTLQLALDSKLDDLAVITDAIIDPEEKGTIEYCGREIQVDNSKVLLKGSKTIAGSCANQLEMYQSFATTFQLSLVDLSKIFSTNPARIAGLKHVGSLEVGKRADFIVMAKDLELKSTWIAGNKVFDHKK